MVRKVAYLSIWRGLACWMKTLRQEKLFILFFSACVRKF